MRLKKSKNKQKNLTKIIILNMKQLQSLKNQQKKLMKI